MQPNPYSAPAQFDSDYAEDREPIARPVGVWIATVWAGLFAGLFPLVAILFLLGGGGWREFMTELQLAFSAALGLGVVISAVGAWRGSSAARYVLVVLVIIHYGLVAYSNYQLAEMGVLKGGMTAGVTRAVGRILTGTIIAAYLTMSSKANAFFAQYR